MKDLKSEHEQAVLKLKELQAKSREVAVEVERQIGRVMLLEELLAAPQGDIDTSLLIGEEDGAGG